MENESLIFKYIMEILSASILIGQEEAIKSFECSYRMTNDNIYLLAIKAFNEYRNKNKPWRLK